MYKHKFWCTIGVIKINIMSLLAYKYITEMWKTAYIFTASHKLASSAYKINFLSSKGLIKQTWMRSRHWMEKLPWPRVETSQHLQHGQTLIETFSLLQFWHLFLYAHYQQFNKSTHITHDVASFISRSEAQQFVENWSLWFLTQPYICPTTQFVNS